jgi:hypothetical protein
MPNSHLRDCFQAAADLLIDAASQSPSPASLHLRTFDVSERIANMKKYTDAINSNASKFTLISKPTKAGGKPNLSKDVDFMATQMLACCVNIRKDMDGIPAEAGKTLYAELLSCLGTVVGSYLTLLNSVLDPPCALPAEADSFPQLFASMNPFTNIMVSTGQVYEATDAFRDVSTSNQQAVRKVWNQYSNLISDAIDELGDLIKKEASEECDKVSSNKDDDSESDWSDDDEELSTEEKETAVRCLALMKLTKLLVRKVLQRGLDPLRDSSVVVLKSQEGSSEDVSDKNDDKNDENAAVTQNLWQDTLPEYIIKMSEVVDNLSCGCYPPQNKHALTQYASDLMQLGVKVIDLVSPHIASSASAENNTNTSHQEWFDKCKQQYFVLVETLLDRASCR